MARPGPFQDDDSVQDLGYGREPGPLFDPHPSGWERPTRRWRLPPDYRGEWSETPGDSLYTPHDPLYFGLDKGNAIPFVEGVPDFSDYAVQTPAGYPGIVYVEHLTGDAADAWGNRIEDKSDRAKAIDAIAAREGWDPKGVKQWLKENNLRLHHFSLNQMQIVPDRLHRIFHHGSASELRGTAPVED